MDKGDEIMPNLENVTTGQLAEELSRQVNDKNLRGIITNDLLNELIRKTEDVYLNNADCTWSLRGLWGPITDALKELRVHRHV